MGAGSRMAGFIWKSRVPLKLELFPWQLVDNKPQVAVNLVKRGWKGLVSCCLCGGVGKVLFHVVFVETTRRRDTSPSILGFHHGFFEAFLLFFLHAMVGI
jgi:hypothetical protein